jgi:hypothetical protein
MLLTLLGEKIEKSETLSRFCRQYPVAHVCYSVYVGWVDVCGQLLSLEFQRGGTRYPPAGGLCPDSGTEISVSPHRDR